MTLTLNSSPLSRSINPDVRDFLNDHIAKEFDAVRPFSETLVLAVIRHCNLEAGKLLLDVGCGPGFYCIPIQLESHCLAFGLDDSSNMIAEAKAKDANDKVTWIVGDAAGFQRPGTFNAIFGSNIVHLLFEQGKIEAAAANWALSLVEGGIVALAYCSAENMQLQPHVKHFPGVLERAARRATETSRLIPVLSRAGISDLNTTTVNQSIRTTPSALVQIAERQATSTLRLMATEDAVGYADALVEYRAAIAREYKDASVIDYDYSLTLLTGKRS